MQVDVQQGREEPQVGGDRGLEREQAKDPPLGGGGQGLA
jgi:hypothetical protein